MRATALSSGVRGRGMGTKGNSRNLGDPHGCPRAKRDIGSAIRKGKVAERTMSGVGLIHSRGVTG